MLLFLSGDECDEVSNSHVDPLIEWVCGSSAFGYDDPCEGVIVSGLQLRLSRPFG